MDRELIAHFQATCKQFYFSIIFRSINMSISLITKNIKEMEGEIKTHFHSTKERLEQLEGKLQKDADPSSLQDQLEDLKQMVQKQQREINAFHVMDQRPYLDCEEQNRHGEQEYTEAFKAYMKWGDDSHVTKLQTKALSQYVDNQEAGILTTQRVARELNSNLERLSPMRRIAKVTEISTDALELVEYAGQDVAGWTENFNDIMASNENTVLKKRVIPVHELYAQPKATQKLIDDPTIDIEEWIYTSIVDVLARKESHAFLHGDGNGKPKGLLTYPEGNGEERIEQVNSGVNGGLNVNSLINLFFRLGEEYAAGAKFLMSRDAIQAVRKLRDENGNYLWQPALNASMPDTLLGLEVVHCADMPTMGDGTLSVAVGDFSKAYQIVDRFQVRVMRDPYTNKPFVKYYTTKRVGGDVIDFNAVKILRLSE
jgi:HK97 family phage major capsid protein